jgi:hypothetical protein
MTDVHRAFLDAQPAYDAALDKASALGAPPQTLNALLTPDIVEIGSSRTVPREVTLFPLTLGGYLLIRAEAPAWLDGGPVNVKDQAVVLLALTKPEWVRGNVSFGENCQVQVNQPALARELTGIIHDTDSWLWPQALEHFNRQLATMLGERNGAEECDPFIATPGAMASPPAEDATPVTRDGSA